MRERAHAEPDRIRRRPVADSYRCEGDPVSRGPPLLQGRRAPLQAYDSMMPSVAKRLNITSIRWGGSFAPPSSHQVITAMKEPTTYWTDQFARNNVRGLPVNRCRKLVAYQIGDYLANSAESDRTAPATN